MDKKPVLYFCMIMWNRWTEAEEVIRNIYPYVDKLVLIDGGSVDGTIEGSQKIAEKYNDKYCSVDWDIIGQFPERGLFDHELKEMREAKLNIIQFEWKDDFIATRQTYIDVVTKLRQPDELSWFILSDTDEYLSKRLRERLRKICTWADDKRMKLLKVRCRSVELNDKGERINEHMDNYGKELIFKWTSDLAIEGKLVHHGFKPGYLKSEREVLELPSYFEDGIDKEILYEHRKQGLKTIWEHAHCRNWFIYASNFAASNQLWKPFRNLVDECMVEDGFGKPKSWIDYRTYLEKGNINTKLKNWFFRYAMEGVKERDYTIWPKSLAETYYETHPHPETGLLCDIAYNGASEIREGYKYYYRIIHPEEELDKYKSLNIP